MFVSISFFTANTMVKMDHTEHNAQFTAQFEQGPQEGDTIRTARDGNAHSVAGAKEGVGADVNLERWEHGEMVQRTKLIASLSIDRTASEMLVRT